MMTKFLLKILVFYLKHTQFFIDVKFTINKLKKYQNILSGKLLDIGAGDKPYAKYIKNVETYTGTNTKKHYLKKNLDYVSKYTDVWIEDGTNLPFEDNYFDCVVCFQVLSVIKNPELFFKEVNRVLKNDGIFILTHNFIYPKWGNENYLRHTDKNLKLLSEKNNFEVIKIESYGGFWTMFYSLIARYIRSYPGKLKSKRHKLLIPINIIIYLISLILLPLISCMGFLIYLSEKNLVNEFDYTMNNMLIARKRVS